MNDKVHYPFKALSQVFERDSQYLQVSLEAHHRILDGLRLHEGVPVDVRELYETARNVALYSYFAYRLHQSAEMIGFSAFEMALRVRAQAELPELFEGGKLPALGKLAKTAAERNWLSDDRYPSRHARAEHFARHIKSAEACDYMRKHGLAEIPVEEPTEADIESAMQRLRIAGDFLADAARKRNNLAHGSRTLMPSVFGTLGLISESINQLFNCPEEAVP